MHKKSFIKHGRGFVLFGYLINYMSEKLIPFPGARYGDNEVVYREYNSLFSAHLFSN